jgi:hypothetical protein
MPNDRTSFEQRALLAWQHLQQVIDPLLLTAPRLSWDQVDRRLVNYLNAHVVDTAWMNHLSFLVLVSASHTRLDVRTVTQRLQVLHRGWKTIFPAYEISHFTQWDPAEHLRRYRLDPNLEPSLHMRQEFLSTYTASTRSVEMYLRALPEKERAIYRQWGLPLLPAAMREQLARHKEVQAIQAHRRKAESDAVTPHFARIRGEAHLRWNEIHRLRQKYHEVAALVQSGKATPPVSFSYEEPRRRHCFHFILWDRPSFVLAHADQYDQSTLRKARRKHRAFQPDRNHFFLEFTGAENMAEANSPRDPDGLLWFGDLLHYDVLGRKSLFGTPEEVQRKQAYLRSWGYGADEDPEAGTLPFQANHPGLLTESSSDGTSRFLRLAQQRTKGLLFLVEPFFAAATFGLASLDFFTTTGARMTELLQVSLSADCLYTMEIGGAQRLLVRLIPKGADKPAEYMVGSETKRNLERVGFMLKEQYALQALEALPCVSFNPATHREHDFPDPRPYLFQYQGQHMSHKAITACMRFLCHGMAFTSADQKPIVLKAHLLRHVFATHLHQVEQVPLDIVAKILHQKDVRLTGYYAAPQWQQVVETTDHLLDTFATHLGNVEDAFVRAPVALHQQWEEAKQSVGSLARVIGGECCCHAMCPISFACTGCAYKIPDPARREEIVQQRQWACIRYEQVKRQGLGPETVKMQALIQRCNTFLQEMDLMEEYRHDEAYHPKLVLETGDQRTEAAAPVATQTLPGETPADHHARQGQCQSPRR